MRERLIELLEIAHKHCSDCDCSECSLRCERDCEAINIADYLLNNGVIIPPCKVGDTVWGYWIDDGIIMIDELYVMSEMQAIVMKGLWGKKVFATKKQAQEEAEARLEELKNEQER